MREGPEFKSNELDLGKKGRWGEGKAGAGICAVDAPPPTTTVTTTRMQKTHTYQYFPHICLPPLLPPYLHQHHCRNYRLTISTHLPPSSYARVKFASAPPPHTHTCTSTTAGTAANDALSSLMLRWG